MCFVFLSLKTKILRNGTKFAMRMMVRNDLSVVKNDKKPGLSYQRLPDLVAMYRFILSSIAYRSIHWLGRSLSSTRAATVLLASQTH